MWIYLKASTSSLELEEFPKLSINGVQQNITAKSTPTVKQSCSQEWQVETSIRLLSGMTLQHSTQENWEPSTSLSAASHNENRARTLALQDMEQVWKESEVDYFSRSCAWPKKSSPNSYSLKTYQLLQQEGDFKLLEKLPKWGMIVDGVLYPLQALELYTKEKDFSYLPTCGANEYKGSGKKRFKASREFRGAKMSEGLRSSETDPIYIHPNFAEVVMGYNLGWSELTPWGMQWFLAKRKKRLKC